MSKQEGEPSIKPEEGELSKVMRLGSGEIVIDREDSHIHEGLLNLVKQSLSQINAEGKQSIYKEINFDYDIGKRALLETRADDVIIYAQRPRRLGLTRFVKGREAEACSTLTIGLRALDINSGGKETIYEIRTAFIGSITPSEPWDEKSFSKEPDPVYARNESKDFWNNHALVYGEEPILSGTETTECPW